jgi:predicted Zn-dependent protease
MTPQETVERALAAARCDDCVVIADVTSQANLRWAANSLTTNGVSRSRQLTVIAITRGADGTRAGVVSRAGVREDQVADVVAAAEWAAGQGSPAEDAQVLLGPADRQAFGTKEEPDPGQPGWDDQPGRTGIGVFSTFSPALGEAFQAAAATGRKLYGYAQHSLTSTFLGTSTGLRLRHDQPAGKADINAKTAGPGGSAWTGQATSDFTDVDVAAIAADLGRRLDWGRRQVELPAGRYQTLLCPSAMADLFVYLYWSAGAKDALDGRTVFSKPGGGTRVGERLASLPVTLRSDPGAAGLRCAPFVIARTSGREASVFDNGLAIPPVTWLDQGVLTALAQTRWTAGLSGLPATPSTGNLIFEAAGGGGAGLDELIAGTRRGLLVTCLWYVREVDPQTMLLTGLTRDGVYLVEDGEVTGAVNNFRFNESPVGLLGRLAEVGATVPALPREWSDYFTRSAMPPARFEDFNMSSVSQAS